MKDNTLTIIVLTAEQVDALNNAIGHYENDSGRNDIPIACSILDQLP